MRGCQEITELIERSKIERISIGDRLELRMHLAICKHCRQYFRDSMALDEMMQSKRFRHLSEHTFSNAEKEKLKALLESKTNS